MLKNIPIRTFASRSALLSLDTSSDPLSTMNNLDKIVIGFNAPYAVMNTSHPSSKLLNV